jgi:multimeric flavodoxin WrbA
MKKGVIILGSSNSNGETFKISEYVSRQTGFPIVDLKTKKILPFDYDFNNRNDDFFSLFENIVSGYDVLIFATPVYWYSMSGTMKIFFDRISDCLKIYKDMGRKLRGKKMAVISSGSDKELKPGFHMPFIETAKYLGMIYIADVHCCENNSQEENRNNLNEFIENLTNKEY